MDKRRPAPEGPAATPKRRLLFSQLLARTKADLQRELAAQALEPYGEAGGVAWRADDLLLSLQSWRASIRPSQATADANPDAPAASVGVRCGCCKITNARSSDPGGVVMMQAMQL